MLGCGGQNGVKEANRYVAEVNTAQTRFSETVAAVGAVGAGGDRQANAAAVGRLSNAVDRVIVDLRAVEPPERVAALHTRLIGAIRSFSGALKTARRGFRSRDPVTILAHRERLLNAGRRVTSRTNDTIAAINRALKS